jgi:hypothetical protein
VTDFEQWQQRHPHAAADLLITLRAMSQHTPEGGEGKTEAWSQQRARFRIAEQGAHAWRNNVGATPSKCPHCKEKLPVVRYGLMNDSSKLNARIKSGDLVLAIPRVIRPQDVGTTIAQFGMVETKRPGWVYSGNEREAAQAAALSLISSLGGFACFSTGEVTL